jgi:hypothetical protein
MGQKCGTGPQSKLKKKSLNIWQKRKEEDATFNENKNNNIHSYFYGSTAFASPGLLIVDVSRSHSRYMPLIRIPLYEGAARRRDFYLTTHNINK